MSIKIPGTIFGKDGKDELERILAEEDEPAKPAVPLFSGAGYRYDTVIDGLDYCQAMGVLRQDYAVGRIPNQPTHHLGGKTVVRPLTMKETALARIECYETQKNPDGSKRTEEERLALFNTVLFTSSGIAYKAGSSKFKIVQVSDELVGIAEDNNLPSLPISYKNIAGDELDIKSGKYYEPLTIKEVLKHPGWLALFEGDTDALKSYVDLVFKLRDNQDKNMSFGVDKKPLQDCMRALVLSDIKYGSDANGFSNLLDNCAHFVRVNPS